MGRNDGPNEADDPRMDDEDSTIESVLNQMISERIAAHLGLQMVREVDAAVNRARPQLWNDLVAVVKAEVRSALAESDLGVQVRRHVDKTLPSAIADRLLNTDAIAKGLSNVEAKVADDVRERLRNEIDRERVKLWSDLVRVVKAEVKEAIGTPGPPHIKPDWDDRFPRASSFVHPNPSYGLYGTMFSSISPDAVRDAGVDYKVDEQQRRALRRLKHELRRLAIQVAERELAELGGTDAPREERARFNLAMVCDILKS